MVLVCVTECRQTRGAQTAAAGHEPAAGRAGASSSSMSAACAASASTKPAAASSSAAIPPMRRAGCAISSPAAPAPPSRRWRSRKPPPSASAWCAFRVRDSRTRWGSCSSSGTLSFTWRLALTPDFVVDYLAAHEVAHLAEMNHGPRFWKLCQQLTGGDSPSRAPGCGPMGRRYWRSGSELTCFTAGIDCKCRIETPARRPHIAAHETRPPQRSVAFTHPPRLRRRRRTLAGGEAARSQCRWRFRLRRAHHRHLLPPVLFVAAGQARQCRILCRPAASAASRLSRLQALPARHAESGTAAGRARLQIAAAR